VSRFVRPAKKAARNEGWQVVYMDLLTNVTIFFLILWVISQRQETGISDKMGDETVKMVNLPGDVLYSPGAAELTTDGRLVMEKLFKDDSGTVLSFDTGGLTKRLLMVHGHTDSDGSKAENFELGYRRAVAAYLEIAKYSSEVPDHVVICSHADNSPSQEVPAFSGSLSAAEAQAVKEAKAKNRRITIEDKLVNRFQRESP
jgi:outer membrane protein OmpA-like peptidoglycan-associated protein